MAGFSVFFFWFRLARLPTAVGFFFVCFATASLCRCRRGSARCDSRTCDRARCTLSRADSTASSACCVPCRCSCGTTPRPSPGGCPRRRTSRRADDAAGCQSSCLCWFSAHSARASQHALRAPQPCSLVFANGTGTVHHRRGGGRCELSGRHRVAGPDESATATRGARRGGSHLQRVLPRQLGNALSAAGARAVDANAQRPEPLQLVCGGAAARGDQGFFFLGCAH